MSSFTTEADVRRMFQLPITTVSSECILDCIGQAHLEITDRLDPAADLTLSAARLSTGEALLTGARIWMRLAARAAAETDPEKLAHLSDQTAALAAVAEDTEQSAWEFLAPVIAVEALRTAATVTDTQSVTAEA